MILKLFMWGSLVFFENGSPLQFYVSVLLSVVQLCIQIQLQPFVKNEVNNMQLVSLILSVCTSVVSLCFQYTSALLKSFDLTPKQRSVYNSSKDVLGILLAVVTVFSYLFILYKCSRHYFKYVRKIKAKVTHVLSAIKSASSLSHERKKEKDKNKNSNVQLELNKSKTEETELQLQLTENPMNKSKTIYDNL